MTVGILRLVLFLQESNSLKDKRMILHSLKAKLRNSFNIAVAQVDDEDKWQKAVLAVVSVGKNRQNLNSNLSEVVNFVEAFGNLNLIDYEMEII